MTTRRSGWMAMLVVCASACMSMEIPEDQLEPGEGGDARPDSGPGEGCEAEGEDRPGVDPSIFDACCPDYGGARCVPAELVSTGQQAQLDTCDGGGYCVPEEFIAGGSAYAPAACTSLGGAPGACMSGCIPEVGKVFDILPVDVCPAHLRCAPCIDPISGQSTGACDTGAACEPPGGVGPGDGGQPPTPAASCCAGRGTCLAPAIIGERAADLGPDECPEDSGDLCVPNVFLDGNFEPPTCTTSLIALIFGADYEDGRCLPECLPAVDNFLLLQDGCAAGFTCAPCLDPLSGGPSGACDL